MTITTTTFDFVVPRELTPNWPNKEQAYITVTYKWDDCSDLICIESLQFDPLVFIALNSYSTLDIFNRLQDAARNNRDSQIKDQLIDEEKAQPDEKWENLRLATNY